MCQRKPAPRCAAHAQADIDSATAEVRAILSGGPGDSGAALQRLQRAGLDFAGTPTGRKKYEALADAAHTSGDLDAETGYRNSIAVGLNLRAHRAEAAVSARAADNNPQYVDHLTEEALTRAELNLAIRQAGPDEPLSAREEALSRSADALSERTWELAYDNDWAPPAEEGLRPWRCTDCGRWAVDSHTCPPPSLMTEDEAARLGTAHRMAGISYEHLPPRVQEACDLNSEGETASWLSDAYTMAYAQAGQRLKCSSCGRFARPDHTCPDNTVAGAETDSSPAGDGAVSDPLDAFATNPIRGRIYSDIDKDGRVEAMKDDLKESIAQVVKEGRLAEYLDAMARSRLGNWSFGNRLLALSQVAALRAQLPDDDPYKTSAPVLMSAAAWKREYGAYPKKGSKAVWILAPVTYKVTETDENGKEVEKFRVKGFRPQAEFDVCQMQGDKLPPPSFFAAPVPGQAPPGAVKGLIDRVDKTGYTFSYEEQRGSNPDAGTGTLGYTDPATKRLVVDPRCNPALTVNVLAHELGHIKNGHVDDLAEYNKHRGRMETEAEATAYMVSRALGVEKESADSFSSQYIAGWSKADPEVVEKALTKATKAFNEIMDGEWPDSDD